MTLGVFFMAAHNFQFIGLLGKMFQKAGMFIGVVVAIGVLYCTYLYAIRCWMLRKFKGPLALPLVGNCYDPDSLFFLRLLSKLRKRYGKIFTFFAFTKPFLVVCDPVVIRRVLSDTKTFYKGAEYTQIFSIGFGQGLVTSNGEKHKADRGTFGRFFIRSNLAKFMPRVNEFAIDAIEKSLVHADGQPHAHNMEHFFATLALRVFASFSMGVDYRQYPAREKKICKMVSEGSFLIGQLCILPVPIWNIIPQVSQVKASVRVVWEELQSAIKTRKALLARGEEAPDDCMQAMLNENLAEQDMLDHFTTLICAGHDTTAYFSSYFCFLLATHPKEQQILREEILRVVGDRQDVTADDITEMKYFQMAMQETLRLYAIIPQVTRVAVEEVHIKEANVTIPKGADILIPFFLINRDPEFWESPSEFRPERFEGKGKEFTSAKDGFFPFGYGSRTCIGNTMAQLEVGVFSCHLLRRFSIEPQPGFKPNIMSGISLTTSNGINVVMRPL